MEDEQVVALVRYILGEKRQCVTYSKTCAGPEVRIDADGVLACTYIRPSLNISCIERVKSGSVDGRAILPHEKGITIFFVSASWDGMGEGWGNDVDE